MRTIALTVLLALALIPAPARAESEAEKTLKYQMVTLQQSLRLANDRAAALSGANELLQRQANAAKAAAATTNTAHTDAVSQRASRAIIADVGKQVAEHGSRILATSEALRSITEAGAEAAEKAAEAATQSERRTEAVSTNQVIFAFFTLLSGLLGWLKMRNKLTNLHDLVLKVEVNSNGKMETLIKAKDELLAVNKQSSDALVAMLEKRLALEKEASLAKQEIL